MVNCVDLKDEGKDRQGIQDAEAGEAVRIWGWFLKVLYEILLRCGSQMGIILPIEVAGAADQIVCW